MQAGEFAPLDAEKLTNLIGHLSNLELKPLRKYFNDKAHKNGDYWDEKRLKKFFDRWMLHEWRVDPEKDKDKDEGKPGDYGRLCQDWKEHQGTVIEFWLETAPFRTIPPYQDNNNRRPPRCQSLVLNPVFLDNHYPEWQTWLGALKELKTVQEYLGNFEGELKNLKSGKKQPYFSDENKKAGERKKDSGRRTFKDLNARILQFIFDRVKDDDPLNLNKIYSHAKKYRQCQSTPKQKEEVKEQLEEAVEESQLPDCLKTPRNYGNDALFTKDSFLHLVCNYYKIRQRAKEGRVFIHPEYRLVQGRGYENTGRFDDRNHLLTYCNHKPRQKRYQMLEDLAGLLRISPKDLEKSVDKQDEAAPDEKLFNWLNDIPKLRTNCERAAKEQKARRGKLKLDIKTIYVLIDHARQKQTDPPIKKVLSDSKVREAPQLYDFCETAKNLCLTITKYLYDDSKQKQWQEDLNRNRFAAVYLLAQVNNIAFTERSGNANTCAVCSMDNAQRMQMKGSHAKAQRLPAIATRLIDGAVMRMARIVGGAIAEDKWCRIRGDLEAGKPVRVPIITESNRFEFEPSKEDLIKSQRRTPRKGKPLERDGEQALFNDKEKRIREAGGGICPYASTPIKTNGEIDHIIPRSSQHRTLNDEANLIWASREGNRRKANTCLSLGDLRQDYKKAQFGGKNDDEITKWIEKQIGDGEGEDFTFGPYRSFINLNPDEQKAFRHALFLVGHPLREKVINAIDNRTRAFVNGTQRYFAEVLANSLYKKAKAIGKQSLLSFDYFGVEAQDSSRGDGIYHLRKKFEAIDPEIKKHEKPQGRTQDLYSHLIDAQLAFALVADAHRNEGGLKLEMDNRSLWPVNRETGEIHNCGLFYAIRVSPHEMTQTDLQRRKAYDVETHHRELLNKNRPQQVRVSYQIHRDSIISERFFPLIRCFDGKMKKGFHPDNAVPYRESDFNCLSPYLQKGKSLNKNYEVWIVKKKQAQEFLMEVGVRGAGQAENKVAKLLDELSYQTVKKSIQSVLRSIKKPPETVQDALQVWECFINEDKFKKDKVLLPIFNEWCRLKTELAKADKDQSLQDFLKNCAVFCSTQKHHHKKVRKVYSLPVVATIGNIRLKRKAWNGNTIVQTVPEEGLAKYGYAGQYRPHTILNKNSIPKKHYKGIPPKFCIEARKWISVPLEEIEEKEGANKIIRGAQIINTDADRCEVRLTASSIKDLALPQDKTNWTGKIICHDNDGSLKEAQEKNTKGDHHHCLSSEWQWFAEPFTLPQDRRKVKMQCNSDSVIITFTVRKSQKIKKWLFSDNS